jgi:PAS domain S-box-containing protein
MITLESPLLEMMDRSKNGELLGQHLQKVCHEAEKIYQNADQASDSLVGAQSPLQDRVMQLRDALEALRTAEESLLEEKAELMTAHESTLNTCKHYQEIFEQAPDGYLITDRLGVIQEANQAAARLLESTPEALLRQPLSNFVVESYRKTFQLKVNQVTAVRQEREWEVKLQRQNGEPFDAAFTISVKHDEMGRITALYWLLRDATVRKKAEEHLRQVQIQNIQIVEADRVKQQFISTVSHELRTPMNSILGFSDLLLRRFHEQSDPQQLSMIERIFRNSRHLLMLIEEMLDLSKLKTNHLELKIESCDLAEIVQTTANEIRPLALRKNVELQVEVGQAPLMVLNDRTRLKQILMNLLSNAVKFTNIGRICLKVQKLSDEQVLLVLSDTGIGIAPEHQPCIFQEFWQANQSLSRQQGGIGLGLAITGGLIRLMGGTIAVESQLGQGSTFRVELPYQVKTVDTVTEGQYNQHAGKLF